MKLIDQSNAGAAMFRYSTRPPPHNLFANAQLLMKEGGKVHPPPALFTYVSRKARAVGAPVGSFTVNFLSGFATSYQWDPKTGTWLRSIFGAPDVTATGVRVAPTNVIVMSVDYKGGVGVEGSYAQMVDTVLSRSSPMDACKRVRGSAATSGWIRRTVRPRVRSSRCAPARPGSSCSRPVRPSASTRVPNSSPTHGVVS